MGLGAIGREDAGQPFPEHPLQLPAWPLPRNRDTIPGEPRTLCMERRAPAQTRGQRDPESSSLVQEAAAHGQAVALPGPSGAVHGAVPRSGSQQPEQDARGSALGTRPLPCGAELSLSRRPAAAQLCPPSQAAPQPGPPHLLDEQTHENIPRPHLTRSFGPARLIRDGPGARKGSAPNTAPVITSR